MRKRQLLHTLKKQNEVRHLLLDLTNGAGKAKLSQLTNSVETLVATGTQFQMSEKADAVAQEWAANEGFEFPKKDQRVFDTLKNAIALAMSLGHTHVYDPRYINLKGPRINATGAVIFEKWRGMAPKDYEYAVDGLKIIDSPKLPSNHGLNMAPATTVEFLTVLKKAVALKDAIGPTEEFILGGD